MTNLSSSHFEERLVALIKNTEYCLLTLTGLFSKFPVFSEKHVLSEEGKSAGQQPILVAFEVAIAKLAKMMPSDLKALRVTVQQGAEKESPTDATSWDYR